MHSKTTEEQKFMLFLVLYEFSTYVRHSWY